MKSTMRRSGIDFIGDISWGTHFCQFYDTPQDLIDILVPYFKEGLASNEFCMWVTSEPLQVDQATEALRAAVPDLDNYIRRGQIEILDYSQWYTRSGKFSADEVLRGWVDKLNAALKQGYEGLRLTGNTFWLERADWDDFTRYEETIDSVIGQYPMMAICTYSLQKCSVLEILDVVTNHQFALIKRSGQWQIIKSAQQLKIAQALQESELRYEITLASIGDAVIATDVLGRITFMNAVAEKLTGWTFHESSMHPVGDVFNIINEYSRQKVEGPVAEVLKMGLIAGLANHTILIRKDGTEVAIDDSGAPIKDRDGNTSGVVLVFRDITERRRAEEKLKQANESLVLAQRASGAGVWDWDIKTGRIEWSEELFDLFGIDKKIGVASFESWNSVLHPDDVKIANLRIDQALKEHTNLNSEYRIIRPEGQVRWINALGHGRYDDQGRPIRMIGICIDITERKEAEDALRKAKDELEQKVLERTSQLQKAKEELEAANRELKAELEEHETLERELIRAKESAEAAAEAKASFLANMSHELRTPMNSVIGFTSLLLDGDNLNPEQKEFIEGIRNGGEAMIALINDLLDFSSADKKKIELEHSPISLKHLIDESLDMVAFVADKKGLNLSYTIKYGMPDTIIGDHGRLRQILVNLLSNAVKFTDKGDVSVSVSSKVVEGNIRQILFSVKDTGMGIPQDNLSKIFEPFTQLERTISMKREGVGLGLAITKGLVELMGGKIWAESTVGQGTTFHVKIRADTIPGKNPVLGDADEKTVTNSPSGKKALRVLVAEDNPSNQKVLVEMLRRMGHRSDAVSDGLEVVRALERLPYDLILMDVRMPEMDGITATQVIRKLWPNGPKIIAITAYALDGDRERCLEAGMDDYMSKPVQKKELEAILMRYSGESV